MFSGIIDNKFAITSIDEKDSMAKLKVSVDSQFAKGLSQGASIAVNGVCLTVSDFSPSHIEFDIMSPTLAKTNLGFLSVGTFVNMERSLHQGAENGGHEVSGHIDSTAVVTDAIKHDNGNFQLQLKLEPQWMKYIFIHGFLAINGASLTVAELDKVGATLDIWLIPETLERTNLSKITVGSVLNLEINRATQVLVDTIADVASDIIKSQIKDGDVDLDRAADLLNGQYQTMNQTINE